jgi:hemoglobin/transferrin/lactoferrin receptor protein
MKISTFIMLFCLNIAFSQAITDSTKTKQLQEVIITSPKYFKNKKSISQKIEVINKEEVEFQNFQTTADVLANSGTVTVQKSQQGGGSPVIRGFEANRILLMVDGIRQNNLIFRAGHLQNIITVDENMLENVSLFFGSSSTIFGSDALGGTVNMTTKKTLFSSSGKNELKGNFVSRFSSANKEQSYYGDINFGTKNFASLTAFSFNDFDDLKMGKKKNHHNQYFGERDYYVVTTNGTDVLTLNNDKYIQKKSGYKQYNFMQKLSYKTQNGSNHGLNFQYSTTSNVPRYDRLTDASSSTGLKSAEWYYGPQKRLLGVYTFNKQKAFLKSDLNIDLSYQNVEESRNNRNFGSLNLNKRIEKVNAFGLNINLKRDFAKSDLVYGFESFYDDLKSSANKININTGESAPIDSRYPNGKNNMFRNELFIAFNQKINEKTNWNIGGRAGFTTLNSSINDNSFFNLPFDKINQSNFVYSNAIGIIHKPSKTVDLIANISTGYRVPNIDDLAKIFESSAGNVIVPNENLKPEKTITVDFGLNINSNNKRFSMENNFFYIHIKDAIVTDAFTFNGDTQIMYDGSLSAVFANQNKQKAFITGFSSVVKMYVVENLLFNASFNTTYGRIIENNSQKPLDHIPPVFGKIGFNYSKKQYGLEIYMLYNGKKSINDYFLNGEDNEQYAPNGGMPAWETYNAKAFVSVFKNTTLFAGVENILDTQYRTFASGINSAGRNIYTSLRLSF